MITELSPRESFALIMGIWVFIVLMLSMALNFFTRAAIDKANKIREIEKTLCSVKGAAWEANHRINLKTGTCTRCGKQLL